MTQESKALEQKPDFGELLPCPFCNSEPEWINEAVADDHFYIRCPYCHIVIKEDRRDKAIGMWNRRDGYNTLQSENQRLTKINEELVAFLEEMQDSNYPGCNHTIPGQWKNKGKELIETHKRSVTPKSEIE